MLSEVPEQAAGVNCPHGLNPCFNGICSLSGVIFFKYTDEEVLILVLMEYAL